MRLFVYGTLKPDQPGFRFLKKLSPSKQITYSVATLPGYGLFDWDGLPIAVRPEESNQLNNSPVNGFLLDIDTDDEESLLAHLDSYELGENSQRKLTRQELSILVESQTVTAWAYVLEISKETDLYKRISANEIGNGNWTMSQDWMFVRVVPKIYIETKQLLKARNGDDLTHHIRILGNYLALYSCLERFGLHLYGPRRYNKKDREPLQKRLSETFFEKNSCSKWFEPKLSATVFDSDTMNRQNLEASPPGFWATMRNNSAHQGKNAFGNYTELLEKASASLADFLTLALVNLDDFLGAEPGQDYYGQGVSVAIKERWQTDKFSPKSNFLQEVLAIQK